MTFFIFLIQNLYCQPSIPDSFPSDVPLPKYSLYEGCLHINDGGIVLRFISSQTIKENLNFYKNEMKLNGYKLTENGEALMNDYSGGIISWKKGNKEVAMLLGINYDSYRTAIVITYK